MDKQQQKELFKRVDEVLYYVWDPIGVSDAPEARGEYDNYVPTIVGLLLTGNEESVAHVLSHIVTNSIGLSSNEAHNIEIARLLFRHKDSIIEGLR